MTDRVIGWVGEPFCSQDCKDKADNILGTMAALGQQGPCTFCMSPVKYSLSERTGKAFVLQGQKAFLCRNCEGRAKDHMKSVTECALCRRRLS